MAKLANFLIITILTLNFNVSFAQDDVENGYYDLPAIIEGSDTIPYVALPQVYVFPVLKFKSAKQEKFYWRTVRDVKKTLPHAKAIAAVLNEINAELEKIPNEKDKKKFMKSKEDVLLGQFEPQLKKLSLRQGKLLIRLVDRQCDRTSYELIKDYRGGTRAFFWQGFARLFGANLKSEFDPNDPDDQIIERVILLVENGQL